MLVKCMLYILYNSDGPFSFIHFLVALYEEPKRRVKYEEPNLENKSLRDRLLDFNEKHGLRAGDVKIVRDVFIHDYKSIDILLKDLVNLSVEDVMTYIDYFELDIPKKDISDKFNDLIDYVVKLCITFDKMPAITIRRK